MDSQYKPMLYSRCDCCVLVPLDFISVLVAFLGGGNFRPTFLFSFCKIELGLYKYNNIFMNMYVFQQDAKSNYFEIYSTALLLLLRLFLLLRHLLHVILFVRDKLQQKKVKLCSTMSPCL